MGRCTIILFRLKGFAIVFFAFTNRSSTSVRSVWLVVFDDEAIREALLYIAGNFAIGCFRFHLLAGNYDEFKDVGSFQKNLVLFGPRVL